MRKDQIHHLKTGSIMKKSLLIILTLIYSLGLMGQKMFVDIETSNPSPTVGERFNLSYVLKNGVKLNDVRIGQLKLPSEFNVISEGSSSSNKMVSINNQIQSSTTIKYTFTIICNKVGQYQINPFSFYISGEEYKSGKLTLNIKKSTFNNKLKPNDPNLFARIEVNKRNIYKGEAVTVSYKVYTRYNGFAIEDYEMPMTNGFWKEEIKSPGNGWPQTTQTVNGMNYYVLTLKKEVIIPQKTGEIKLKPMDITALIGRSFFNSGQQKNVRSNSPTLTVKSLPTPTPASFSNQVGSNYKLDLSYSTKKLKTNEPLDVKVTIEGRGNLKQLTTPVLNFPQDFEVFDPEVKDNTKIGNSGVSGKKSFNYLVIPRHRGTFEIPEYEFTYFDISSKKYKTLTQPAQTIVVEKGDNETETTNTSQSATKQNVEILNSDIRHINETTILYAKKDSIYNTLMYWLLIITPFILALVTYIYVVVKRKTTKDEATHRTKNASKNATNKLKKASELLSQNKHIEFYEELYSALTKYCSHKLRIPNASLNKEIITKKLNENNVSNETTAQLIKILDECEMARFSPVTQSGAEQTLNDSNTIINQIEKDVKK